MMSVDITFDDGSIDYANVPFELKLFTECSMHDVLTAYSQEIVQPWKTFFSA